MLLCDIHSSSSAVESRSNCVLSSLGHLQRWSAFSEADRQLGHLSSSASLYLWSWTLVAQKFECCFASQIRKPVVLEDSATSSDCQSTSSNCVVDHPRWVHKKFLAFNLLHSNRRGCEMSDGSLLWLMNIAHCSSGRRLVFRCGVPDWMDRVA